MIRFQNGIPNAIWYSQHAKGQAFEYRAVKKDETGSRVFMSRRLILRYLERELISTP